MQRFFSINEISSILKINRKTVFRWIQTDKLKAFKLGGGRFWRIRERDLRAFLKESSSSKKTAIPNSKQGQDHSSVKFW
jgi:excisionase family DNA binding protein